MSYKIFRISGGYRVKDAAGNIKAKRTTLTKAKGQVRLLEGIEHHTLVPRHTVRKVD